MKFKYSRFRLPITSIAGRLFGALIVFNVCLTSGLFAQAQPTDGQDQPAEEGTAGNPAEEGLPADEYFRRSELSRIRIFFGLGEARLKPAILNEITPSWFLNSAIAAGNDINYQAILPLEEADKVNVYTGHFGIDYTFMDRFNVGYHYLHRQREFNDHSPTKITFFAPPDNRFRWAVFESYRLKEYVESMQTLEFKYLHPVWTRGFKIGPYVAREWYREHNDSSFGSFVAPNASAPYLPNSINWSALAFTPVNYSMTGWVFGPAFRYQMFDWLGFHYRFVFVKRTGSFNLSGVQPLNREQGGTLTAIDLIAPVAGGNVNEEGIRHNFETVFRIYCRYGLHIGIIKEDFTRSYSNYLGYTFGSGGYYSMKTPTLLGIGELSNSYASNTLEVYIKFSTAFFF
ncbi:MAG: hypothetical protein KDK30_03195 [Leptospiraceae bacterium]|nr:hypothetical protein [Leptospiraceae bacterium]MCB1316410.1 hypothetical protein [Leptospiraceae bacterium]